MSEESIIFVPLVLSLLSLVWLASLDTETKSVIIATTVFVVSVLLATILFVTLGGVL